MTTLLCLSRYGPLGASSRLRTHQYLSHFESHGLRTQVHALLGDAYVRRLYSGRRHLTIAMRGYASQAMTVLQSRYDRILLEKELFPWLPAWIDQAMLPDTPFVLDLDDAIFHNYDSHAAPWVRTLLGGKIEGLMSRAAVVTAGNEYLADRARSAGAREVAVVPTSVDVERYRAGPLRSRGRLTIGWIGTPVTQGYLRSIAGALREAVLKLGMRVVLVGATQEPRDWFPCEIRGWRESMEVDDIQDFDIGIMPLPDEPWERGKCGYKLIQYMACGRAIIASPVGVNVALTHSGDCGLLATEESQWYGAIRSLAFDAGMREEMGRNSRSMVEQRFSTAVNGPRMARAVSDLRAS